MAVGCKDPKIIEITQPLIAELVPKEVDLRLLPYSSPRSLIVVV